MQSETHQNRFSTSIDHKLVAELLRSLENEDLIPSRDESGKLRYEKAEQILGEKPEKTRDVLEEMVENRILDKAVITKEVGCPTCGSVNISTVYRCSKCASFDISKNALIEHVSCGNIGPRDSYLTSNKLICPNCHLDLGSDSWKNIGSWYECSKCNRRISTPDPQHICRNCSTKFLFDNAGYDSVYSYSLREGMGDQHIHLSSTYRPFREVLGEKGYDLSEMGSMKGESGVLHEFDLLASKNGKVIAIEVAFEDEGVTQTRIVHWFAKVIDTKVSAYFIAIPSLDSGAKKLASAYKLETIEAQSPETGALGLKDVLE